MGVVQDIIDFFKTFKFSNTVYEYEQGLFLRKGATIETRLKRLKPELEKKCETEEEKELKRIGKESFLYIVTDFPADWAAYLSCCFPLTKPKFSDGFIRSFYSGLPLYKERFSKILQQGWYWYTPIVDEIIKASTQEDVMDIKEITFQTTEDNPNDSKTMILSYNVRYKLMNIYKAYMAVKDYETTLEDQALSMGKRSIRRMIRKVIKNDAENGGKDTVKYGMSFADCTTPDKEEELERKIEKELRKIATEKWGVEILDVYITDLAECRISKLAHSEHPSVKYRHNTPPLEEL